MSDREKNGKKKRSGKRRKSSKVKKDQAKLDERRTENEVHNLLPDSRKAVRSEAKKLFEEDESDLVTDRTPETPYNSDKELDNEALRQSHELDHNNLLAALNMVENNANVETKGVQSTYEPIDNATLQTAIPLLPLPPRPTTNCPLIPQKFSFGAVYPSPPHVMSAQPSDSNSSLISKTGDAHSLSYSSSLGGSSVNSTTPSLSNTSLPSQTGSINSATGLSLPSSMSNVSLISQTGSNVSKSENGTDSSRSEKTGTPSPSVSSSSLISQTFSPMTSTSSPVSPSLISYTISPLKESTMQETSDKTKSPLDPPLILPLSSSIPSTVPLTATSFKSALNNKMPVDGHTSSIRSPVDERKDIHRSSQTPIRERPQDFTLGITSTKDSRYQPSGKYNSKGEFCPADTTLDDIPDIPFEKSEESGKSPPMRTATESTSSTSLAILPDKIYGELDEEEIGAKSDKQFVGRMTLKKNKKNEAGFEFEPKDEKEGRSKPRTPRKIKVTNVFGGTDRKYVPPVKLNKSTRHKSITVPPCPSPLPDDSRAHLTTVSNPSKSHLTTVTDASRAMRGTVTEREDLQNAESLPLSVTKKSEKTATSVTTDTSPTMMYHPTPIHLLRTENSLLSSELPPSITHSPTPTTSPAAMSPLRKKNKRKKERKERKERKNKDRELLSGESVTPMTPSPPRSKKKGEERKKRGDKREHNTQHERVVYREKPVSPTIGTPKRKYQNVHNKKREKEESKNERDKKRDEKKMKERRESNEKTSPIYQQLVYSSYVSNGLNVASYNYEQRKEQKKKGEVN